MRCVADAALPIRIHLLQLCTPRSFTFIKSFEIVVMVVLGGMGSVRMLLPWERLE